MAAPKTVLTFPLDGSRKDFDIPFEYLARKFVVLTLVGATRRVLVANSDYRFATKRTVTTTKAWGPGDLFTNIEIRRVTSATERLVDFSDGSVLRAYDLNTAQVQSLHIAEEARDLTADTIAVNNDGDLDARGRKIVNVADGVLDGDAVSLGQNRRWAESALNQANRAETEASRAAWNNNQSYTNNVQSYQNLVVASSSAGAAADSQAWAQRWAANPVNALVSGGFYSAFHYATFAAQHRDTANGAAKNALDSQNATLADANRAAVSATNARAEADRAKAEADKLGNTNAFAATIDNVQGGVPRFKGAVVVGGSGGVTLRKEDTAEAAAVNIRVVHSADGGVRLIDDARGRVRWNSTTEGHFVVSNGVDAGSDIACRSGSFRSYAASAAANTHFWWHNSDGGTRAVAYSTPNGDINFAAGYGVNNSATIVMTANGTIKSPGGVVLADARYSLLSDGNIASPIFVGGTLHQWLSKLSAIVPRPMGTTLLWTGTTANGTVMSLSDDAFNFEFFYGIYGNGAWATFSGVRELAQAPVGTQAYLSVAPNSYILCKFNDTVPGQRRLLHLVTFGANSGFNSFYGMRTNSPS